MTEGACEIVKGA